MNSAFKYECVGPNGTVMSTFVPDADLSRSLHAAVGLTPYIPTTTMNREESLNASLDEIRSALMKEIPGHGMTTIGLVELLITRSKRAQADLKRELDTSLAAQRFLELTISDLRLDLRKAQAQAPKPKPLWTRAITEGGLFKVFTIRNGNVVDFSPTPLSEAAAEAVIADLNSREVS